MKLLLDQDIYAATLRLLVYLNHDVVTVAQIGLARATDVAILRFAQQQNRILVTGDRDYGNLVFVKELGAGVIYLRMVPSTVEVVHSELERVLAVHSEQDLTRAFVVVEPGGHRIRRLPGAV